MGQDDYHRVDFFIGYSHNRVDTGIGDRNPSLRDIIDEREGFNGFNTSITGNISRFTGIKGDFSAHFKRRDVAGPFGRFDIDDSLYNFLVGVQLKDNTRDMTSVRPFAHFLVGGAHFRRKADEVRCQQAIGAPCFAVEFSDTGFAGALGGGLDVRLSDRYDLRAFQFDYNPARIADRTQHNFRIGVGLVIH